MPLAPIGAELLFEVISQRYEQGPILVTTSYPSTSGPMYSARTGSPTTCTSWI